MKTTTRKPRAMTPERAIKAAQKALNDAKLSVTKLEVATAAFRAMNDNNGTGRKAVRFAPARGRKAASRPRGRPRASTTSAGAPA